MESGFIDQRGIFRDPFYHADNVHFLITQLAKAFGTCSGHTGFAFDLAGNDKHRNGIGPRAEHSIKGIDATGTGSNIDYTGSSAHASIGFSRDCASLFVMIAYVPKARFHAE